KKTLLKIAFFAASMSALSGCQSNREEARVKRENEFIDQELKNKAAQTDVIQSNADSNRNMSEGGRDLMKSEGKAREKKASGWFN
ncbi:DUF5384 family protein, partial [Salmonella enterica subsp. enterica serovar Cerro]|nr:DUF5384 family protein [Salmonella enterica subsp. enterica serovar Cerro]